MSRFMRLMVFFDLPVTSFEQRKQATQFRNYLIKDGFYMLQFSVYARVCNTIESAKLHEERLKLHLPSNGSVRSMIVTEKQYASMNILSGKKKKKEKNVLDGQMSFF